MLNAMQEGRMRRGYVLTPKGVQLGLNADLMQTGDWKWQKLNSRSVEPPDDSNAPKDWETAAGTIAVAGKTLGMGTVLIDTGLTNMMVSSPVRPRAETFPTARRSRCIFWAANSAMSSPAATRMILRPRAR
ncbi:hypothetical protein ACFQBQ_08405 [Granulicella cerasi]|uniref:Uncharacterized protein n=1 Tax=Granulicella cerasi TaxID=741063 RepID=A0ABW1Z873_9BACT